jgi:hypothetical protein
MKKVLQTYPDDDLRREYDLRTLLKDGVQGKYAGGFEAGASLVLLDPDVAQAFPTEETVNEALRLVIQLRKIPVGQKRHRSKTAEAVRR